MNKWRQYEQLKAKLKKLALPAAVYEDVLRLVAEALGKKNARFHPVTIT